MNLLPERLDAIGRALRDSGHALALISLGSAWARPAGPRIAWMPGPTSTSSTRCAMRRHPATRSTASAGSKRASPALADELPVLMPGCTQTPAAAVAMLAALQRRGADLGAAVVARIRALVAPARQAG